MPHLKLPNNVLLPEVEKLLRNEMNVTLKVKGNSMLPFIVGDRDSVVLTKASTLHCGDMALARLDDGRYVIHRVISMDGEQVTLMGDGNLVGTEHCRKSAICGRVVKIIRNGKYVEADAQSELRKAKLWRMLKPIRRYLLAIYGRM